MASRVKGEILSNIQSNWTQLLDKMDPWPVIEALCSKKGITWKTYEDMKSLSTPREQTHKLLERVRLGSQQLCDLLLQSLEQAHQANIAKLLLENTSNGG